MNNELLHKIEHLTAHVGVIGLGYVGLPLAARAARVGFSVMGFDVDERRIEIINSGASNVEDVPSDAICDLRASERLAATTDFGLLHAV